MRVLFLGAPGSGKGTQAEKLKESKGFTVLTASSLLRSQLKSGDSLGQQIQARMEQGALVSDEVVWAVVQQAAQHCIEQGQSYILDGYPRSAIQLEYIQKSAINYDYLVYFEVSDAVVIERVCGRRVHPGSGRTYHTKYAPARVADKDDITGEPLVHRKDDQIEVVKQRLQTYQEKTLPIVASVQDDIEAGRGRIRHVLRLDANQPIALVTQALEAVL